MRAQRNRFAYRDASSATVVSVRRTTDAVLTWVLLATALTPLLTFPVFLYPHIASKVFFILIV